MSAMQEDVWISSSCSICFSFCPIRVHRVNGVVTKIEGNPDDPVTNGRICARGLSGMMLLYDPNRVNTPLKRTNPEKGIGIDPKWVPISWDEAIETIVAKLKKIQAEDPKKLLVSGSVAIMDATNLLFSFGLAFGSPNTWVGGAGNHCGNGKHLIGGLTHAAWSAQPDPNYCNYFLNFGVPTGTGAYYGVTAMVQRMADARDRGMKHVCIDPWLGMPAENADEWIPIRPGTDAALALAMVNLLLNEYGIYDIENLKGHTNAPYLVKSDGHYLRDSDDKPLMWDSVDGRAKPYDAEFKDFALEGEYTIEGVTVRPAFALLKQHVRKYTPEMAAQITDIPPSTIRRLAREFGEAAQVGNTIVIEGKEFPYRPVTVAYFKGPQAHRHSTLICMAFELLGAIVGAHGPGGFIGMNARSLGHPETGFPQWSPKEGPDGLLATGRWMAGTPPWPSAEPQKPNDVGLGQLITTCVVSSIAPMVMLDPGKYGLHYKPEMHIQMGTNYIMCLADPEKIAEAFKDVFTVDINIFLDESAEIADIVLPDASYLERLSIYADWMSSGSPVDYWSYCIRQPVVKPIYERRPANQVLLEIAEKVGLLPDMYTLMNVIFEFREPHNLDPQKKYSWEEIVDRRYKSWFGEKYGLEWFKKNGVLSWPKKAEEVYWHPFVKTRVPVYFEHFLTLKEQIESIREETALFEELDLGDYQPFPDWKPCPSHEEKRTDFDLFAIYFRVPYHSFTFTTENPWLDEVARTDPNAYFININAETANRKGIKEGDWVEMESAATGQKVRAQAKLGEGIHPEVVAVGGYGGHWVKTLPIASQPGKGVAFNWLLRQSFEYMDTMSLNQDLCVKVKLTKVVGP